MACIGQIRPLRTNFTSLGSLYIVMRVQALQEKVHGKEANSVEFFLSARLFFERFFKANFGSF